jgi:RNA polymerase subunit RPABC4/transcription elongation factor Spt4
MSEQTAMKTCRMCAMEIPAKAKKCPYCHHWQNWYRIFAPNKSLMAGLIIVILVLICFQIVMNKMFDRGRGFAPYRSQISLLDTEMVFGDGQCGPIIAIMGRIKNDSDVVWRDVQYEVEFHDAAGKMVDTVQGGQYSSVVQAHQIHPFKFSSEREFPKESYVSFQIRVLTARDAKAVF